MNTPGDTAAPATARKPRLLWANAYCLLDSSSGASMSVREMLKQLARSGFEVHILGCTVFDSERGTVGLGEAWPTIQQRRGQMVTVKDGPLNHRLYVTAATKRALVQSPEQTAWFAQYLSHLEHIKPDIVFYYGGHPIDLLIALEARLRGIPVAFYLVNGNYHTSMWCRDVDLVLTDSQATADLYKQRIGMPVTPVGKFIDPARVVAKSPTRERVLFVNPRIEKGAGLVIQLAVMLEKRRPDIVFEVVESRGEWPGLLNTVTTAMGAPRDSLSNVVVTPSTNDMRAPYGRARLLLAPSLWWESGARVVVEALLNGIPALVTDRGGLPELVRDGGVLLRLPDEMHVKPYNRVPPTEVLEPIARQIEALYDDQLLYSQLCARALEVAKRQHRLPVSTARLLAALAPLAQRRAGDADQAAALRQWHRHGLAYHATGEMGAEATL